MNPCSDARSFYALVRPACGRDLSSAECRTAVSGGVNKFGTGCLGLPIAEGNPIFPPFIGYVCDNATGRLGQQCGQYMPPPAPAPAGTGTGPGTGAAAAIGTIGALGGATLYAAAQKFGGMRRAGSEPEPPYSEYNEVDKRGCHTNRLMCVTDAEIDEMLSLHEGSNLSQRLDTAAGGEQPPVDKIQTVVAEYGQTLKKARQDYRNGIHHGDESEHHVLSGEFRRNLQTRLDTVLGEGGNSQMHVVADHVEDKLREQRGEKLNGWNPDVYENNPYTHVGAL